MNTEADKYLMDNLGLAELDKKICQNEVKSFRCCFGIKGINECSMFLEFVRVCYMNKGRTVKKSEFDEDFF